MTITSLSRVILQTRLTHWYCHPALLKGIYGLILRHKCHTLKRKDASTHPTRALSDSNLRGKSLTWKVTYPVPSARLKASQVNFSILSTLHPTQRFMMSTSGGVNTSGPVGRSSHTDKTIEIERRFHLPDGVDTRLKELGATLISTQTQTDSYYDNVNCTFTLTDHWLRQRNSQWQLKYPPERRTQDGKTAQYKETEDEAEIIKILVSVYNDANNKKDFIQTKPSTTNDNQSVSDQGMEHTSLTSIAKLLEGLECEAVATITTKRKSYIIDQIRVDLDSTDFDFQVGEVEVMLEDEAKIPSALKNIDDLFTKLGVTHLPLQGPLLPTSLTSRVAGLAEEDGVTELLMMRDPYYGLDNEVKVAGKLETYLHRCNPEMYSKLVNAGVLTSVITEK